VIKGIKERRKEEAMIDKSDELARLSRIGGKGPFWLASPKSLKRIAVRYSELACTDNFKCPVKMYLLNVH